MFKLIILFEVFKLIILFEVFIMALHWDFKILFVYALPLRAILMYHKFGYHVYADDTQ